MEQSTVGLVSDPDEIGLVGDRTRSYNDGGDSLRVEVSRMVEAEKSLGIITGSDAGRSLDNTVNDTQEIFGSQNEDDVMLSLLEQEVLKHEASTLDSQAITLSLTFNDAIEDHDQPTQATLDFNDAPSFQFTQVQSPFTMDPNSQAVQLSQSQQSHVTSSIDVKQEDSSSTISLYHEPSQIPVSIQNLYSSITEKYSDFCFSYMLAAQLCQSDLPMSVYNQLKLSLLLSVSSIQKSPKSQPFHVITLGAETAVSHLAMSSIGKLARRYIAGMLDPLAGGRVLEDNFVECGATTLARTGVCYIGDWSMLKPSTSARVLRELESGQVIIENHPITYPLECSIWAHWNYSRKPKQDLSSIIVFLNAFGIPIVLPEQTPDSLLDFILEKSLTSDETDDQASLIPEEDIRQFLGMIYFQEVEVSEAASKLLSDYFVTTRLNVPESLTQSSFSALHKLAEAHARLCFRNEVSRLDAVVAIMMCERFIHTVFSNPGNTAPLSDTFDTIDDLEQHFYRFDHWLKEFLRGINRN